MSVGDDHLRAWKAMTEAATPGPWAADLDLFDEATGYVACVVDAKVDLLVHIDTGVPVHRAEPWTDADDVERDARCAEARAGQEMRDAAFVAMSREVVPALIAEVVALRAALKEACALADVTDDVMSINWNQWRARLTALAKLAEGDA